MAVFLLFPFTPTSAQDWEVYSYLESETRIFQHSPAHSGQDPAVGQSFAIEPEFYRSLGAGDSSFLAKPFYRYDLRDDERSHFDVRELYYEKLADNWELRLGVSKVFWGVTESVHLVDVINQTDLVENIDGEDKLGQPMARFAYLTDHGTFSLFYLPYFRERTFPGVEGRLRSHPYVYEDAAVYESGQEEAHPDFAVRWSHVIGDFDIGAYYFYGTSRDPLFQPIAGGAALVPVYNLMHQGGLDIQWTNDGWLLKFEAIRRSGLGQHFHAVSSGFEYTFYQVGGSNYDVGTLAEIHHDSREDLATTPFNHDVFAGARVAFNDEHDTAFLAGGSWDFKNDTSAFRLEFDRRLGQDYTLEIELQKFIQSEPGDPFQAFQRDSFLEVSLRRYF